MGQLIDRKKGGPVPKTGMIHAHKGEFVLTKEQTAEMEALMRKFKAENMMGGRGAKMAPKRA